MMKRRIISILLSCCMMLTLLPTAAFAESNNTAVQEQFDLTVGDIYYFYLTPNAENPDIPENSLHYVPFVYAGTVNAYTLTAENAETATVEEADASKYVHSLFIADNILQFGSIGDFFDLRDKGMIYGREYQFGGVTYDLRAPSTGRREIFNEENQRYEVLLHSNEWDAICDKNQELIHNYSDQSKDSWSYGQDMIRTANGEQNLSRGYMGIRGASYYPGDYWSTKQTWRYGYRPVLEVKDAGATGKDALRVLEVDLSGGLVDGKSTIRLVAGKGSSVTAPPIDGIRTPTGYVTEGFVWRGDNGQSYAPGAQIPAEVSSLTAVWKRETTGLMVGETYYFDLSGINYTQGGTLTPTYELFTEQIPSGTLNYVPFTFVGEVDAYVLNENAYTKPDVDDQAAQTQDANAEYGYTYPHSLFLADCALLEPSHYGVFLNQENFDTWKTLLYGQAYTSGGVTYQMRAPSVGSPANNEWVQIMHKDDRLIVGKDADKAYIGQECNLIGDYKTVYRNSRFWSENQWKLHTLGYLLEGLTEYWRPVLELPQDVRAEDYREVTLDLNGGKIGSDAGPVKLAVKNGSGFTAPKRDGLTPPEGSAGTYLRWVDENGHYYTPGASVPETVRKLTADWATEERFELEPGKTYYFDLSGEGIPGTVNEDLPDTTLHYVPFTYAGNIAAYWDTFNWNQYGKIITADEADRIQNQHSLFVADHNVTNSVSWNALNENWLIFGRFYDGHSCGSENPKLYYTMRAPTGGNTAQAQYPYECESPRCNEWDVLIDKDPNNIKNWQDAFSYAQEIYNEKDSQGNQIIYYRAARGNDSQRRLFSCSPDESYKDNPLYCIGYRPVLEPSVFEEDAMQTVTLDLNGGTLGGSGDNIAIVVSKEESFRAPAGEGLTRPAGDESGTYFFWVDDNGQRYRPGEAVPVGTKKLTAQWRVRELFDLEVGGTYYFDLSGAGIPGVVNEDLPDTTLHYVPFTQVGVVEAYYDNRYLYDRRTDAYSLLIADYNITNDVSWDMLIDAGLIFSRETKFSGVYYALRAPSIGEAGSWERDENSVYFDVITPENNEWDMILKKGDYIKNLEKYESLGQFDGYSRGLLKRYDPGNGTLYEIQTWFQCGSSSRESNLGYRPVLQILNTDSPNNDTGTVTLRLNGGTLGTSNETELKIVTANGASFTAPAREGLTPPAGKENGAFVWLGDDGSYYRPGMTVPAEVSVLTAQWDTATYTVTLPSGTGYTAAAADGSTSPVVSGGSFNFTVTISNGFQKGESFAVKANGITLTENNNKYTISNITENQTVTVEGVEDIPPAPTTYTVTFDANVGTGTMAPVSGVSGAYTLPACGFTAPADKEFKAWSNGGVEYNPGDSITVSGNITVIAIWKDKQITPPAPTTYTVSFDANVGTGTMDPVSGVSGAYTLPACGFTAPADKEFKGWALTPDGDVLTGTTVNVTQDITLYAIWKEKAAPPVTTYTVSFDANGGSVHPASMTTGTNGKLASLPTPTRSSYSFDGWYTEKSGGTKVTTETVFKTESTVYAQWTYTGGSGGDSDYTYYTLTFETNGGSTISSERFRSGATVDLSKYTPTYKGYTFTGWYSDKNLTDKITSAKLDGSKTVYAGWRVEQNPQTGANPFTDISKSDWFYDDVMFVYEKGLMVGTSDTLFSPYGTDTRAMMATILWRMEGSPAPKNAPDFTDVASGKWYSDAIAWTTENGIYQGYGNGAFEPDDPITREQLAAIFYRYADYKGYDMTVKGSLDKFKDKDKVSTWAQDAMQWAVGSGLIQGKTGSALDPQGTATRAEIVAMLHRFIEKYGLVEGKAPGGMTGWIDPKRLKIPQTGDASTLGLWSFTLCASLAGCLALTTVQLRRKREEEALRIIEK